MIKRVLLLVALFTSILPATGGAASETVPVETSISSVQAGLASATNSTGLLGFTAAQDIVAAVGPGERLGGARIDHADHPGSFDGTWAQEGQLGGWLSPPTETPNRHYAPTATLFQNLYFDNSLNSDAPPAVPGDHAEFGMGVVPMDTPLPWDRERTSDRGSLGWDATVVNQEVESHFAGVSGQLDVVMFRADVVARGGDVDARSESVELEPLVLDLPRVYEGVPNYIGLTALSNPYLNYITDFGVVPLPTAGKLVVRASVSGYIPEARAYELPNGAVMKEWHIPLAGVITIDRSGSGLVPTSSTSLPQGGLALATDAAGTRVLEVAPGATVNAQPGASQGDEEVEVDEEQEEAVSETFATRIDLAPQETELITAAEIDTGLDSIVEMDLETSGFRASLDPNYRGEGTLALTDVMTTRAGKSYADAITLPTVQVDGSAVPLDRSRLIDLRALPFRDGGGIGVTPTARFEEFNQSATRFSRIYRPGLLVHAVYDLGNGLHAFVEHQLFHGGVPPGGRVNSSVVIKSLDARSVHAFPTQYVELTEPGPARLGGNEFTSEFSATTGLFVDLNVGDHRTNVDYRTTNRIFGGRVSVLRSPAPLTGRAPDPAVSISGEQVALVQEPPPNLPSSPTTLTIFRVGLANGPLRPPPMPPPLGDPCGDVAVTDGSVPDAVPEVDVREAWFDADGTNVYASLRLTEVPTQPLPPNGNRYAVNWRSDHEGYSARATLLPSGEWDFELGNLTFGSFFRMGDITGEVQAGPDGVIRMAIPRDWLDYEDGALLRDPAAHAFVGTTTVRADHAPEGSSAAYGLGNDHIISTCPGSLPPILDTVLSFTSETTPRAEYGGQATFATRLVDEHGEPVDQADVVFTLSSDEGSRSWIARTDDSGAALVSAEIIERPGAYELAARYEGLKGSYRPSEVVSVLEVERARTTLDLTVEGNGSKRILTGTLSRSGDVSSVAGRTVDFFAGSVLIGSAITDVDGKATLQVPPRYRGGKHAVEARFDGDDYYLGSSDGTQI